MQLLANNISMVTEQGDPSTSFESHNRFMYRVWITRNLDPVWVRQSIHAQVDEISLSQLCRSLKNWVHLSASAKRVA